MNGSYATPVKAGRPCSRTAPDSCTAAGGRRDLRRRALAPAGHAALLLLLALSAWPAQAQAAAPPIGRHEIIARAESAIGSAYTWGRESWVPDARGTGPDCSGFVLKCWEVPRTLLYQEEDGVNATISPRYTTYSFLNGPGPWTALAGRSSLLPGDALVYNDGSSGHIVLYAEGDAWNYPIVYEAPYTGATVRRASRYLGNAYQPRRRTGLTDNSILLDNPSAHTIGGSDVSGTWTRSTSVTGYYGHDYQVRAATTASAWARWTPRLPTTGYYNVYMRWTSGTDRASSARVSVSTATGIVTSYVNQRTGSGSWHNIGRYYFGAGYSPSRGSVTLSATGANGYVVADSVLFALTK